MRTDGDPVVLRNRRVLIVEDRYLVADDLCRVCRRHGGEVAGPVPDVLQALRIAGSDPLDLAILDVDLRGEEVFGVAEALRRRGIPFVFVTGVPRAHLPRAFRGSPLVLKPHTDTDLLAAIVSALAHGG